MNAAQQIVKYNPQVDKLTSILRPQIAIALKQSANSFQEVLVNLKFDWANKKLILRNTYQDCKKFDIVTWDNLPSRLAINFSDAEVVEITDAIALEIKPDLIRLLNSKKATGVSGMVLFVKQGRLTGVTMEESRSARSQPSSDPTA